MWSHFIYVTVIRENIFWGSIQYIFKHSHTAGSEEHTLHLQKSNTCCLFKPKKKRCKNIPKNTTKKKELSKLHTQNSSILTRNNMLQWNQMWNSKKKNEKKKKKDCEFAQIINSQTWKPNICLPTAIKWRNTCVRSDTFREKQKNLANGIFPWSEMIVLTAQTCHAKKNHSLYAFQAQTHQTEQTQTTHTAHTSHLKQSIHSANYSTPNKTLDTVYRRT